MAKSYFYSVELYHSENREEKTLEKSFKNHNYQISRKEAFLYAKELFTIYEDEFIRKESLIPIKLTINFIVSNRESEMESGVIGVYDHIKKIPLYNLTFGKLEELGNHITSEMEFLKLLTDSAKTEEIFEFARNVATITGEIEVISSMRESVAQTDPRIHAAAKSNFQIITCSRCDKKMEVENQIANLFLDKRYKSQKVLMSCISCIQIYYSDPKYTFYLEEIFDKDGKSVRKGKRDLDFKY